MKAETTKDYITLTGTWDELNDLKDSIDDALSDLEDENRQDSEGHMYVIEIKEHQ